MADPGLLQLQMKRNTEDLQDYLRDLGNWEDEIKKKDAMLHKQKPVLKKACQSAHSTQLARSVSIKDLRLHCMRIMQRACFRLSSYLYTSWWLCMSTVKCVFIAI